MDLNSLNQEIERELDNILGYIKDCIPKKQYLRLHYFVGEYYPLRRLLEFQQKDIKKEWELPSDVFEIINTLYNL